jgi:hypothetical protein
VRRSDRSPGSGDCHSLADSAAVLNELYGLAAPAKIVELDMAEAENDIEMTVGFGTVRQRDASGVTGETGPLNIHGDICVEQENTGASLGSSRRLHSGRNGTCRWAVAMPAA